MKHFSLLLILTFLSFHLSPHSAAASDSANHDVYTSPKHIFSVPMPKPTNWAGIPYEVKVLDSGGDPKYEKVMFFVSDFGDFLVAGVRHVSANVIAAMDKDTHHTVLSNISGASLMGWRGDLAELPKVTEESFFDSKYGEAIERVYRVEKGSLLARWQGGQGQEEPESYDTNIVSIVAKQGGLIVFVLAQDDRTPDDFAPVSKKAMSLFNDIKVLQTD